MANSKAVLHARGLLAVSVRDGKPESYLRELRTNLAVAKIEDRIITVLDGITLTAAQEDRIIAILRGQSDGK